MWGRGVVRGLHELGVKCMLFPTDTDEIGLPGAEDWIVLAGWSCRKKWEKESSEVEYLPKGADRWLCGWIACWEQAEIGGKEKKENPCQAICSQILCQRPQLAGPLREQVSADAWNQNLPVDLPVRNSIVAITVSPSAEKILPTPWQLESCLGHWKGKGLEVSGSRCAGRRDAEDWEAEQMECSWSCTGGEVWFKRRNSYLISWSTDMFSNWRSNFWVHLCYIYIIYIYIFVSCKGFWWFLLAFEAYVILQELNACLTEFTVGHSLTTQRRDVILNRHCVPWTRYVCIYIYIALYIYICFFGCRHICSVLMT